MMDLTFTNRTACSLLFKLSLTGILTFDESIFFMILLNPKRFQGHTFRKFHPRNTMDFHFHIRIFTVCSHCTYLQQQQFVLKLFVQAIKSIRQINICFICKNLLLDIIYNIFYTNAMAALTNLTNLGNFFRTSLDIMNNMETNEKAL